MKKLVTIGLIFLLLVGAITAVTLTTSAATAPYSGTHGSLSWELDPETGALTVTGSGQMNAFTGVSTAAWRAHANEIQSVTVGDGITTLGNFAFYQCTKLKSVTLPATMSSIGASTFTYSGIEEITLPSGITTVGNYALANCSHLKHIEIPEGVQTIGANAFNGCYRMTSVTLPSTLTEIGNNAFSSCESLRSITLPSRLQAIKQNAFSGCSSLTSLTLPSSLTSIEASAFNNCFKLVEIINHSSLSPVKGSTENGGVAYYAKWVHTGATRLVNQDDYLFFSDGDTAYLLTYVGDKTDLTLPAAYNGGGYDIYHHAFYRWRIDSDLTSVVIPDAVGKIGEMAFNGSRQMTSLSLGRGLTEIGDRAFRGCGISTLTLSDSLTYVGHSAFEGCSNLQTVSGGTGAVSLQSGVFASCKALTEVDLPTGATEIGGEIFNDCQSLERVSVPATVQTIGSSAFQNCSSLVSITLPNGITEIGQNTFLGCKALSSVSLPDSVTTIGKAAFSGCSSLSELALPEELTSLGAQAFLGCSSLGELRLPEGLTTLSAQAFKGCSSLTEMELPEGITVLSSGLFSGCTKLSSVTFLGELTKIDGNAFENCEKLKTVAIPETVKSIGSKAFYNCYELTDITLPNGITSIGSSTFYQCYKLNKIVIPEGVTKIHAYAFYCCIALKEVTIPSTVTEIWEYAFLECTGLESVYFSSLDTWHSVYMYNFQSNPAFYADHEYLNGELVTKLTIPESVTEIKDGVFAGFADVTELVLPDSLKTIGICSFKRCLGLTSVTIPKNVTEIKEGGFHECVNIKTVINLSRLYIRKGQSTHGDVAKYATELLNHICQYTLPQPLNDTEHKLACSRQCGKYLTEAHHWDNGEQTKPASHTERGEKTFTCTDGCGQTYIEYSDKLPDHEHGGWTSVDGTTHQRVCPCGDTITGQHHWDNGAVTTPATHTAYGEKTFTCTDNCGATYTEQIAKTPEHTYSAWIKVNDTTHKKVCACLHEVTESHHWNSGVVTTPATHTALGEKTFTCTDNCGATYTEQIAKAPDHAYGTWTKVDDTKHAKTCACGDTVEADHTWDQGVVTKEPTADAEGEVMITCSDCGATLTHSVEKLPAVTTDGDGNIVGVDSDELDKAKEEAGCNASASWHILWVLLPTAALAIRKKQRHI